MATETASSSPGAPVPGQLPWELLATPSRDYFQWVQRRYGLTAAGACMASLASILCAVGTSHRVICPVDFAFLPAAYSAVLHGAIGLHIKGAVNLSLAPIREWISQRIGKGGKGLLGQARMHIAELHELLIQNDFLLQNAKSPPIPGTERFMMSEGDPEVRRSEIESQRKIILQQIEGHAFRLAPHLLADNTAMRQLLQLDAGPLFGTRRSAKKPAAVSADFQADRMMNRVVVWHPCNRLDDFAVAAWVN